MQEADQRYIRIPLTQHRFAIINTEDLDEIGKHQWMFSNEGASRNATKEERQTMGVCRIWMHRQIMGHPAGLEVDHANGDRLDNSRDNLRIANRHQNMCNALLQPPLSGIRGVERIPSKTKNSWCSHIQFQGKREYLGSFPSAEEAFAAYEKRGRELHGEFFVLDRPPLKDHSLIPITTRIPRSNQSSSGFRGVYPRKDGEWQAVVRHQRKNIYLGHFTDPQLASAAVEAKIKELRP